MDGKRIGNFIKFKRQELGLTIEQFCAEMDVERFLAEKWENGEIPETQYLIALAKVLQASVEELLKGLDKPVEEQETNEPIIQSVESETVENKQPKAEKGYYEKLNEQIAKTDYANYECVEPHGSNGFTDGERKFGFILCSFMLVLMILINVTNVFTFLTRPRELTIENYKEFLEIEVVAQNSVNEGKFEIQISRKRNTYDIKNFQITVEIKFEKALDAPYSKGEKVEMRQAIFSDEILTEFETLNRTVILPSVLYNDRKITVISVSGEM